MKRMILAMMLALLPLAALAQGPSTQKAKALEKYTRTGKREACIPRLRIESTQIVDASTILFFVGGSVYLNELPRECAFLNPLRAIKYTTSLNQLCNTDIITVIDTGSSVFELGSCGLGQFEKLEQKK